jgi:dUTP pyrophosphatase
MRALGGAARSTLSRRHARRRTLARPEETEVYGSQNRRRIRRGMAAEVEAPRVEVRVLDRRIHEWGLPNYQSAMAAGIDLFACIDEPLLLRAGSPAELVPSGLAIHLAQLTMVGLIFPRSGLGHKKGLVLGNSVGVLDADYTGPLMISMWNRNPVDSEPVIINPGDRVAQLVFLPIVRPTFQIVADFTVGVTARGSGGFGSTGNGVSSAGTTLADLGTSNAG